MFVKRFFEPSIAQSSYLIGCARTGESIVIDANRDIEQYIEAADREGLRITHVTETHIHADFVSGSRELARRAGARLLLSDEGGANWKYQFVGDGSGLSKEHYQLLHDGDRIAVGNVFLVHEIPRTKTVVTQCQSGARSSIAASLLEQPGFQAGAEFEWRPGSLARRWLTDRRRGRCDASL